MTSIKVLLDFFRGKHTSGQMLNLFKYFCGKNKSVIEWDPISITIFLTDKCNLHCDMCLSHSTKFKNPFGHKPSRDMDFELYKQILNRYRNAISVNIIGTGEPLLSKNLFKMIDYASSTMKMDVYSSSNGILVGKYINEIITSRLTQLDISLNGHNPDEFSRMTGMDPELFEVICSNIVALVKQKRIKSSKVKIVTSSILDQYNFKYIKDMIYFQNGLGVDKIIFFPFLPVAEDGFRAEERCLFADSHDVKKVFKELSGLPLEIRKKVELPSLLDRNMSNNRLCSVWFSTICVDGDGNVGGCPCQLLDLSESGKFSDENVWNNKYFQLMRKRFLDSELPLLEPCVLCRSNSPQSKRWIINSNPLFRLIHILKKLINS